MSSILNAPVDPTRFKPQTLPRVDALGDLRTRMQRTGQWHAHQIAGRRWPVACVSLEITQRCNLDCTLCYLSESSEAVRSLQRDLMPNSSARHGRSLPGRRTFVSTPASRTLWLSELLNFYPEDFVPGAAPSLLAYANLHVAQAAPADFRVRFTPYDWTMANSRRRP